jgi:indolepyruvate ferredoxin oxidoreductase
VWHRDRLDEAQHLLREVDGVTVIVYDQACAAELRRNRRRGTAETPKHRIYINEAVCEGCGHCGAISNCLSVHPVDTPFGSKTQIHQESCNFDFSCVDGNCPAFVKVVPAGAADPTRTYPMPEAPEPADPLSEANILLVGIGGTGVVTANQLLATAAMIDGKHASSLDQTGLSQKAGPVVSNLKITLEPTDESNRIGVGAADTYLAFDLLAGSNPKNLSRAHPDRTTAVVSTGRIPTGSMVLRSGLDFPQLDRFRAAIDPMTRPDSNLWVDADHLARHLYGSQAAANIIVIGAAYQHGLIPVTAAALHQAIDLNGVAAEMNRSAFAVGRLAAHDPAAAAALVPEPVQRSERAPSPSAALADRSPELVEALDRWARHLTGYQSARYARSYLDAIEAVSAAERAVDAESDGLAIAVANNLGKLMAYKDEYEVARLHRSGAFHDAIVRQFGDGATVSYLLRPPTLESFGLKSKIAMPSFIAQPAFATLIALKRLRGTWLDPFGHSAERRMERRLIGEYRSVVDDLCAKLDSSNLAVATEIAALPDMVRGYSSIKLAAVDRYRLELARLLDRFSAH